MMKDNEIKGNDTAVLPIFTQFNPPGLSILFQQKLPNQMLALYVQKCLLDIGQVTEKYCVIPVSL
ncbi:MULTISPECIES: hypothetical protein [Citrobacter freundii complex]|uniref:Uncharacterized protein n=1 Tax=Citrobacter cronae TaxID=1748967 RepID=A0A7X1BN52_9ENTR|nr:MULTISPECIES: hypothetical protein [Citrobacter]AYL65538.1 hypothetical protein CUC50_05395 [Citrobacter werkmanii]MBC2618718.1 hypothetical protein [Citrobacter cronae]MBJ8402807.1 hypothetical protein [Citrobacter cronae]MBY6244928.1 hypothetical protein [Citrobacter werkmanii]MDE9720529.1 hypothetical protein [Citrobacter cronae]